MRRTAGLLLLLGLLTAAGAASDDVRAVAGAAIDRDEAGVRAGLDELGGWAAVALVLGAVVHVLVPFPAELLTAAAGYALGTAVGLPLMLGAWVLSGLVAYWLAESAGRPLARRLAGEGRLARVERVLERGGVRALLLMRLIPLLPFNAVCAAAGIAGVPLGRYLWTTLVGITPLTALVVVLGARLQAPDLGDPVLWLALGGCGALAVVAPLVVQRRDRQASGERA